MDMTAKRFLVLQMQLFPLLFVFTTALFLVFKQIIISSHVEK